VSIARTRLSAEPLFIQYPHAPPAKRVRRSEKHCAHIKLKLHFENAEALRRGAQQLLG